MIKKLSAALLGTAVVLAGCNTMAGMGEDIKRGGEKLEHKAEAVKSGDSSRNASEHSLDSMNRDGMKHESMDGKPVETMTHEGHATTGSDASMWEKAKQKASDIGNSVKEKFSK